jgi:hypothetical protein
MRFALQFAEPLLDRDQPFIESRDWPAFLTGCLVFVVFRVVDFSGKAVFSVA